MLTIAIVQARMGSTRLPGKVLLPLGKKPVLHWAVERTREAVPDVVIATTEEEADNPIAYLGWELETPVVRYGTGEAANDVFTRFRRVLEQYPCDAFVRVTADCPMAEPVLLAGLCDWIGTGTYDYVDGSDKIGYADGIGAEAVLTRALTSVPDWVPTKRDREHVTTLFYEASNRKRAAEMLRTTYGGYWRHPQRYRLTLDTQRDYERLQRIWAGVPHGPHGPDTLKALAWLEQHPEWWGDA